MFRVLRSIEGVLNPLAKFKLFEEVEGEEGAGSGGGSGDGAPVEGSDEAQAATRAASVKGDQGQMIPKARFDEVYNTLKEYKKFGDPGTIRKLQERLEWLEKNPGKVRPDTEISEIERELSQVPAFAETLRAAKSWQAHQQRQAKMYVSEGNRQTESFIKELGREVTEKNKTALTNALSGIIQSDEALLERFLGHDPTVFKDAFLEFRKGLYGDVKHIPGATVQAKKAPVKPVGKPQAAAPKQGAEPKTERDVLDEASDAAYDLLMNHEG